MSTGQLRGRLQVKNDKYVGTSPNSEGFPRNRRINHDTPRIVVLRFYKSACIERCFYPLEGQFPITGSFQAGGILDNKRFLSRNYLFNFLATSSPVNNRIYRMFD